MRAAVFRRSARSKRDRASSVALGRNTVTSPRKSDACRALAPALIDQSFALAECVLDESPSSRRRSESQGRSCDACSWSSVRTGVDSACLRRFDGGRWGYLSPSDSTWASLGERAEGGEAWSARLGTCSGHIVGGALPQLCG